ncbi:mucin-2 [Topomyia yanbarensis]|uniref:mucin-2 n=1 Tax=Topomyia yanbarensis TaxID=2498891 RepID=UPI00273B7B47|nr:mucin-2 [Topomyia yanbarensis]
MPFVQRVVTPKYVARSTKPSHSRGAVSLPVQDYELEAITNLTLSNALRQLASLVFISNQIFTELNKELASVSERSLGIKQRIDNLSKRVEEFDPKQVTVPESDLVIFAQIKTHYKAKHPIDTGLFTAESRSETLQELYDAAAKTPVPAMVEIDRLVGQNGAERRSSEAFMCTPVLGRTRRKHRAKVDMDIETRLPSAVEDLRKWTSVEAIGDVTVPPDCTARLPGNSSTILSTSSQHASPSYQAGTSTSFDETDDIIVVDNSSRCLSREQDTPLDHRLPSPEEQCQMIALKFPAETIRVDTSGRRFDRMCTTRKSLLHFVSVSEQAEPGATQPDGTEGDTIRRRSRPRRSRGKRRNTIAGTDQKEIAEVVNNGDEATISSAISTNMVPRSKSSDILKKESPSPTADNTSKHITKTSHFNSLKQWGRNRLRMINRDSKDRVQDIDDFNITDTTRTSKRKSSDKDVKLSHDRKPSYSSSERSITVASSAGGTASMPASINPVKLRESSSIRRQRRTALGNKDEPHSSSGNWSASSESGRTSIGSEITTTTQPKSSASSTSLNHNHHTISSGPPSSIISRRRFLNTSASSSVTSEGTVTPDLQMYDYHDEGGETSSVYSCDTEGYYTSFHVDSGLKTLKEEEPATPLHSTTALSSTTSFESSGNQTVISPENEYELFGKGSTSTTTSSAGTICTVLAEGNRNSITGPTVPERKSSLTKLNRSNSSASNGTLERSYSSSTVGSTLERTGTIKRNGHLLQKEVAALIHQEDESKKSRIESPDSGNNTSSSPIDSNTNSSPTQRIRSCSEFEYSESSDLECVDRIERIREKTTINTSRIPSMCIITPTNSDDENGSLKRKKEKTYDASQNESVDSKKDSSSSKKNSLLPLNSMLGKLRGVLKKSPSKDSSISESANIDPIYDVTGEYVRIADIKNSKKQGGVYYSNDLLKRNLATVLSGNLNEETEYVSLNELPCNIRCESNVLSAETQNTPCGNGKPNSSTTNGVAHQGEIVDCATKRGARVKLDAHGKVIYSSDSLKRRKGAHTTFAPGPFVKDVNTTSSADIPVTNIPTTSIVTDTASRLASTNTVKNVIASPLLSGGLTNRKSILVKPVISQSALKTKAIINASSTNKNINLVALRMAPIATTLSSISATQEVEKSSVPSHIMSSGVLKGAYVNIQESKPPTTKPQSIHYMEPTPVLTQQSDYPHSSPEEYDHVYGSQPQTYTLPRRPLVQKSQSVQIPPANVISARPNYGNAVYGKTGTFQRSNDMYWTLQTRRRPVCMIPSTSGENANLMQQNVKPIEELYSTPNKLKTTPTGFGAYFSPISKNNTAENLSDEVDCSLKISPIDPRNTAPFKTSTPSKSNETTLLSSRPILSEELRYKLKLQQVGVRSHGSSPISSGRSTPKNVLEAQAPRGRHSWASNSTDIPQTCSDRLGTPKTSLMDFKKLLLAHGSKSNVSPVNKLSAVELLKKTKCNNAVLKPAMPAAKAAANGNLNILDLSGSPKTFASRRMIRQGNFGTNSPSKIANGSKFSARGGWRCSNMRSEVMSTTIPEGNSEEDNSSPNNSTSVSRSQSQSRNITPTVTTTEVNLPTKTVVEKSANEHKISNIRDNIFLQEDENNFMKGEVAIVTQKVNSPALTRAQLQAQRAQFLSNNNHIRSATFKDGHYMGMSSFSSTPTRINEINFNEPASNEVQEADAPNLAAPSLETAL